MKEAGIKDGRLDGWMDGADRQNWQKKLNMRFQNWQTVGVREEQGADWLGSSLFCWDENTFRVLLAGRSLTVFYGANCTWRW